MISKVCAREVLLYTPLLHIIKYDGEYEVITLSFYDAERDRFREEEEEGLGGAIRGGRGSSGLVPQTGSRHRGLDCYTALLSVCPR